MPHQGEKDIQGQRLGHWLNKQRVAGRRGKLTHEFETKLSQLAGWKLTLQASPDSMWQKSYDRLVAWRSKLTQEQRLLTNKWPSTNAQDKAEVFLAKWMERQRRAHVTKQQSTERARSLESLHGWSWRPRDATWQSWCQKLKERLDE